MAALIFRNHIDHFIVFLQQHAADTVCGASRFPDIRHIKTNTHSFFGNQDQILVCVIPFYFDQFIIFRNTDRGQARLPYIGKCGQRCTFYDTPLCCHDQAHIFTDLPDRKYGRDMLIRHELKQVHQCRSAGRAGCFRNLVCLQAICPALVCKEQDVAVVCRHEQIHHGIVLYRLHAFDPFSAPVLHAEIIDGHALDISELGCGDHHVLVRDHILQGYLRRVKHNTGFPFIRVFCPDDQKFIFDHSEQKIFIGKDRLQTLDRFPQFGILCLDLASFQTGQSPEAHVHDSLRLHIIQTEAGHQLVFRFLYICRSSDDAYDFIDIVEGNEQTLQYVSTLLRFIEIILSPSCDDILLMLQVTDQDFFQIQNLGLAVYKGQIVDAKGILQLCMLVKLVENDICIGITPYFDTDLHTFTA